MEKDFIFRFHIYFSASFASYFLVSDIYKYMHIFSDERIVYIIYIYIYIYIYFAYEISLEAYEISLEANVVRGD